MAVVFTPTEAAYLYTGNNAVFTKPAYELRK